MIVAALLTLDNAVVISIAVVVGVFALVRGRSDIWKSNYEAARVKNEQLATEYQACLTELAHLRTLPTLKEMHDLLVKHDAREEEVWNRISLILNEIVQKLNGTPRGPI